MTNNDIKISYDAFYKQWELRYLDDAHDVSYYKTLEEVLGSIEHKTADEKLCLICSCNTAVSWELYVNNKTIVHSCNKHIGKVIHIMTTNTGTREFQLRCIEKDIEGKYDIQCA